MRRPAARAPARLAAVAMLAALHLAGPAHASEPAASPLDIVLAPPAASRALGDVVRLVRLAHRRGERPVVVFDIDDTLVKWNRVNGVSTTGSPMPGGVRFIGDLVRSGAQIVYLTARSEEIDPDKPDVPTPMRIETEKLLRDMGLPLGGPHELIMNPYGLERPAAEGKAVARERIAAKGRTIALFDNDLANVRLFRRQYPDATVVRVAGHSSSSDPQASRGLDGVRVLSNFSHYRPERRMPRRSGKPLRARGKRPSSHIPRARQRQRVRPRPRARR